METLHALFVAMPRFAHIIFDLDGTVVDTKADLAAATNAMLATFGLPQLSVEQVTRYVGNGARVLVERALGPARLHLVAQGFATFMEYYEAHLLDQTRPYPGMVTLLAAAQQQRMVMSILTNKPEAASRAILSGLGLIGFFAAVVGGDSLSVKKPDPHGVMHLQRQTQIPLAETLLVGDSQVDIDTGQAAGVSTCGVTWGFGDLQHGERLPQFLVHTSEALAGLLFS